MNYYSPYQQSRSPFEGAKSFFMGRSALARLIILNVAVWILIRFLDVFFDLFNSAHLTQQLTGWLAVPADPAKLITRPWTVVTYMFLHFDFLHILFNLLWLYWFGKIFTGFLSDRQLVSVYLMGGLSGALLYVVSFNLFPKFEEVYRASLMLGASASVMAVVVAIALYAPGYRLFLLFLGPVKISYIALFSIVLDVLMIKSQNSGGHLAHLGGALWGFAYIRMLRNGNDVAHYFNGLNFSRLSGLFRKRKYARFTNVYTSDRPRTDEEYNAERADRQKRIDRILDKISKSGYESLTREEKELLFRESAKNKM